MGLAGITFYNAMDGCWYQLVNSDNDWEHQPRKKDGTFTYKDGSETKKPDGWVDFSDKPLPEIGIDKIPFGEYEGNSKAEAKAYKKKVLNWYRENLQGSYAENKILGRVYFKSDGIGETLYRNTSTPENLKYIVAVRQIIEQSENVQSEEPLHHEKVWAIRGKVTTGTETRIIPYKIVDDGNGQKYYTFNAN